MSQLDQNVLNVADFSEAASPDVKRALDVQAILKNGSVNQFLASAGRVFSRENLADIISKITEGGTHAVEAVKGVVQLPGGEKLAYRSLATAAGVLVVAGAQAQVILWDRGDASFGEGRRGTASASNDIRTVHSADDFTINEDLGSNSLFKFSTPGYARIPGGTQGNVEGMQNWKVNFFVWDSNTQKFAAWNQPTISFNNLNPQISVTSHTNFEGIQLANIDFEIQMTQQELSQFSVGSRWLVAPLGFADALNNSGDFHRIVSSMGDQQSSWISNSTNQDGAWFRTLDLLGTDRAPFTGKGGFYDPVPEPSTMVALGIGALALLRKRSKA